MTSQQFAVGALISLSITVFTLVSTIYPVIVTPENNNNININREIIKLRNNLSLNYSDIPFKNFDDFEYIIDNLNKSNNKNETIDKFLSILAYREGKILNHNDNNRVLENNSMEYFYKKYVNNDKIEHNEIMWYPLRQLNLENKSKVTNMFNLNNKAIQSLNKNITLYITDIFSQKKDKMMEIFNEDNHYYRQALNDLIGYNILESKIFNKLKSNVIELFKDDNQTINEEVRTNIFKIFNKTKPMIMRVFKEDNQYINEITNMTGTYNEKNQSKKSVNEEIRSNISKIISNNKSNLTEIFNQKKEIHKSLYKFKEEDFFCNDLTNNSMIDEYKKDNNIEDTSYCSNEEIKNIREYSKNYPYVISILNDNPNSSLLNLTEDFRQITDYFKWFIVFSFVLGPLVFFLWIRNYIE